ncbi:MAG: transcription-repair coupling factor, partial [Bacteroidales bacterium]|nr:transcription-repair coupling factor [Bacteroidales bacterium]
MGDTLSENAENGITSFLLTESEKQVERLTAIFTDINKKVRYTPLLKTLHEGFVEKDLKLCCLTDHQIFERYHKYQVNAYFSSKASLSIKELKGLHPGDYVVHIDHGIGRFGGLEKITKNGKQQEAVRLVIKTMTYCMLVFILFT